MTFARRAALFAAAMLITVRTPAGGQQAPESPSGERSGFGLYVEEDLFYPRANQDRNYTAGVAFALTGPVVTRLKAGTVLDAADRILGGAAARGRSQVAGTRGLMLTGSAFTPDSLRAVDPVVGDRPYSSLVALTTWYTTLAFDRATAWRSELSVGMLGLQLGRNVQRWIHYQSRKSSGDSTPVDPKGWANQISNGGEPTARYSLAVQRLLTSVPEPGGWRTFDLSAGARADVGYNTEISGSTVLRIGRVQSEFWEFNSSPMSGVNKAPGNPGRWDLFGFASIRPRLVGYNALLQGQFAKSSYRLPASDIERGVLEFETGVSFARVFPAGQAVQLTVNYPAGRTAEFKGPYRRTHQWASVYLSLR